MNIRKRRPTREEAGMGVEVRPARMVAEVEVTAADVADSDYVSIMVDGAELALVKIEKK